MILTSAARADRHLYGEIGDRVGTVIAIDGWIVVDFRLSVTPHIPEKDLEPA